MKIGIVVYSQTGNTLSVATKLEKKLLSKKYNVFIEQITKEGSSQNRSKINQNDIIIFGAPVHGFNLALEMKTYLEQLPTLEGKKVHCFITHQLPKAWMGGNHSLKQMETLCKNKGAVLIKDGIINWSSKNLNDEIENLVTLISNNIN